MTLMAINRCPTVTFRRSIMPAATTVIRCRGSDCHFSGVVYIDLADYPGSVP